MVLSLMKAHCMVEVLAPTAKAKEKNKAFIKQYADKLIKDGHAYYAFDTPEELEKMRNEFKSAKNPSPQYDHHLRMKMKNSLTLMPDEVEKLLAAGTRHVIRIKMPENEIVSFHRYDTWRN